MNYLSLYAALTIYKLANHNLCFEKVLVFSPQFDFYLESKVF
jgi:hypothetical protein